MTHGGIDPFHTSKHVVVRGGFFKHLQLRFHRKQLGLVPYLDLFPVSNGPQGRFRRVEPSCRHGRCHGPTVGFHPGHGIAVLVLDGGLRHVTRFDRMGLKVAS